MINIDSIASFLLNFAYDIKDTIEGSGTTTLNQSTITLVCVADNSLPEAMINQYCENLEVVYGAYIRSLLSVSTRTRMNSNAASIFKSLPLLTPYDKVKFNEKMEAFESVKNALFTNAKSSSSMVSYFAEECRRELERAEFNKPSLNNTFAMEADAFLKESRAGVPTMVNADILINAFGKTVEKKVSIGIRVIPKLVDKEWLMSFFIKKGKASVSVPGDTFFGKLKSALKVNKNRTKALNVPGLKKKNLVEMFEQVEKINKPFVCILMNNSTASSLEAAGLKIMSPDVLKTIYNKYPVCSVSVINTHLDKITYSLTKECIYQTQTLAEFNSEIATYEKELAEIVRSNARF